LVEASARRAGIIPTPALLEKPLNFPALQDELLAAIARRVPESGAYTIGGADPHARRHSSR
jgi:hypothetical protein